MKGQIFRMAHLGYFDFTDLFGLIAGLELILHANNIPVQFGTGVAACRNSTWRLKARQTAKAARKCSSR